ncbi:ATPase [uncultured Ruthenibacterium sp.]|uniref:ATPase n=1 Tax=uncultured Ruthenibacterium sp. TaxID=1905347 RepID=UPI00349EE7CB
MSIDELLDVMDETLEDALNVPFSGGKRMVDVEKVRDLIDDIRLNMPQEIQQAKAVVKDREQIVEKAKREADMIIKRAEERARAMVAEEAIMKTAQQKATEMIASAQNQSREMRTTVTNYCENMLRQTEEQLSSSLSDVQNVRATLRQSGKRGTRRTQARNTNQ